MRRTASAACLAALSCAAILLAGVPAVAQETSPEFDPFNHAYAVYMGGGLYLSGDQTVFVLRFAPKIKLRDHEKHRFGVRLRLNITLGFYDLNPIDLVELEFPDRLGTFALVPGVEFPIRITKNWVFAPFGDFGAAVDTGTDEVSFVRGFGARSRAEFRDKHDHVYLLWNEFVSARNSDKDFGNSDSYSVFRTDLDIRGLVKYRALKRDWDLGFIAGWDLFLDSLVVDVPFGDPEVIRNRWEVGLTTGSTKKWKVFKKLLTAPRLGVSYRFGEGVSSVHFLLRSRN